MEQDAIIITDHSDLLVEAHPPAPECINPLADLPPEADKYPVSEKLEMLSDLYLDDVTIGLGLTLLMMQCADGAWQWRIRERAEREVRRVGKQDIVDTAMSMMTIYLSREKQMCWTAEALGLSSSMVLDTLRNRAAVAHDYGGSGYMRAAERPTFEPPGLDSHMETILLERHGEPPAEWEPSLYVTGRESEEELYERLAGHFSDDVARMTGIEEMLSRVESVHSSQMIEKIKNARGTGTDTAETFRDEMDSAMSAEAEIVWTSNRLGVSPTRAIAYIQDRLI